MLEEERRLVQRNFYLRLSPFTGHTVADEEAGFMMPDDDIMEAEMRDVLSFWLRLQKGRAGELIANAAWWMTQHMDPEKRYDANTGVQNLDYLTSFAVAVLGVLADAGIVELKEEVDIPDIMLSSSEVFNPNQIDFLKKLEDLLNSETEDGDD